MQWFLQFRQKLLGIQPEDSPKPPERTNEVKSALSPLVQTDNNRRFEEISLTVEPLLKGMAANRWGRDFRYEGQPDSFRWSVWKTDTTTFATEYWSVTMQPASAGVDIRCKAPQVIHTSLSIRDLEKGLSRAARLGPAIRNIPIENILDENI